ncbi:MAG: FixH family protein [Thermohalobaculum sp.]|nr:FixH family protein [Thermohalobaculum sp.]
MKSKELTGRKVLIISVAAFAVILAANLTMMFAATGTFPGVVVRNSYVASQDWNRRTEAQRALGWQAEAAIFSDGLAIRFSDAQGAPVRGLAVTAVVGRPASQAGDRTLELVEEGGLYRVDADFGPGLWRVEIHGADAAGQSFEAEVQLVARSAT